MIPKIIHYCWLSDDPIPKEYQDYIDGWKTIMPDYKIKKWDRSVINLDDHPFAKQAFEAKKYAFAADYIRVYALFHEGGIYLDSDVKVIKRFDGFLKYSYFTSIENQISKLHYRLLIGRYINKDGIRYEGVNLSYFGIQAAIIGSEPNTLYMSELFDYYRGRSFVLADKSLFSVIAPMIHSQIAEKYGFKYVDKYQLLKNNMAIFPSNIFATIGHNIDAETIAVHCCAGSWLNKDSFIKRILKRNKSIMYLNLVVNILKRK